MPSDPRLDYGQGRGGVGVASDVPFWEPSRVRSIGRRRDDETHLHEPLSANFRKQWDQLLEVGQAEAEGVGGEGKVNRLGAQLTRVLEEDPMERARSGSRWWLSVGELRQGCSKGGFHINPMAFEDVDEDRFAQFGGKVEKGGSVLVNIGPVAVG
ncbi:hypothetical protein HBI56_161000 [Parastagonospora nodorum]|nr:hypothetical protein HBI10_185750 [Parastagonospora nodorum]KAH4113625.1 hypothetical protein HBH47_208150 [Parastagonospora nodorum]KAH4261363.1 hypothetical protein HBI04_202720 [Parastagonospora nodorum]KAH4292182.1 hypothetical protein HBI01_183100 [Parastagonospora nodorum]KAH4323487.1 hypothetical protein HBI00_180830 [Parastagonospora nodorum]